MRPLESLAAFLFLLACLPLAGCCCPPPVAGGRPADQALVKSEVVFGPGDAGLERFDGMDDQERKAWVLAVIRALREKMPEGFHTKLGYEGLPLDPDGWVNAESLGVYIQERIAGLRGLVRIAPRYDDHGEASCREMWALPAYKVVVEGITVEPTFEVSVDFPGGPGPVGGR